MESHRAIASERRIVTVLFADLVGFTTLAERLDPEDLATVQDAYFAAVREVVVRYRGRLEKFIGDAAMAVFGAPRVLDDDALRAVRAGLALVNAVGALAGRLGLDADDLRLRVGLNTGEVVLMDGGPDAGRVSGDTVNVAARLQAAAPPGRVLVGGLTALAVADRVELGSPEPLVLKGKSQPVAGCLVLGILDEPSRERAMGRMLAPLLGRSADLASLAAAAERAAGGAAAAVLIVAPPGVGKTRLLREFSARLAVGGLWRRWDARLRPESVGPYDGIAELARAALADLPAPPEAGSPPDPAGPTEHATLATRLVDRGASPARAETVVRDVRRLLGATDPTVGVGDRDALFASWLDALDACAGPRSVAWFVEDLHWAGADLLAFLDAARVRPPGAGRLIVATARPGLLGSAAFAERQGDAGWRIVDLATLPPDASTELVRALIGDVLPAALVERIVDRSDGNCLFIEELLRTWIALGVLRASGDGWTLAIDDGDVPLPPTVQAIYAAQLDDLPPDARSAARRGAVAGRRFPVAALPSLGVERPADALETLRRCALVGEPQPSALVGDELGFRHALLRDAGYASLGRADRADLHVRLARWLEEVGGDRADELAGAIGGHYADALGETPALAVEVGGGLDRGAAAALAASWLERAGERALAIPARAAAADSLRRSVALTAPGARLDLARRQRRLGVAMAGALDLDEAAVAFSTSADLARRVLDDPAESVGNRATARHELAAASVGLSSARYEQLLFADARDVAEAALVVVEPADPVRVELQLARLRGIEGVSNDYAALSVEAATVLEAARATGDPGLVYQARHLELAFRSSGDDGTAGDWLALAGEARRLGRWTGAARALMNAAGVLAETDPSAMPPVLDEAEALAEAWAMTEESAWIALARAEAGLASGDWDAALAAALGGLEIAERLSYDRAAVRTWFVLTPMAEARRDRAVLERAAAWFERHQASFPWSRYGVVQHAAVDLRLAAFGLSTLSSDDDRLLDGLGLAETSPGWLAAIERIVLGFVQNGRLDLAGHAVERASEFAIEGSGPLVRASRALIGAQLEAALGHRSSAATLARAALGHARAATAPWWVVRSVAVLTDLGEAEANETTEAAAAARRLGLPTPEGDPPA